MEKIRLGILFGGKSSEHEVSLHSAASFIPNIDLNKFTPVLIGITKKGEWLLYKGELSDIPCGKWQEKAKKDLLENPGEFAFSLLGGNKNLKDMVDFVFPIMHGQNAEDGTLQGLLELLDIPYAGCGVASSALCMDKAFAKEICVAKGIPQTPYVFLHSDEISDEKVEEISQKLKYPLFVKPVNMGSSVGITKVLYEAELKKALLFAAKYDDRLLVEQGVVGRELEVAVIGNRKPTACEIGEILAGDAFYSYDAKYNNAESKTIIDPLLSEAKKEEIKLLAEKAYEALGCEGFARVDFLMDYEENVMLNEINTIPGFTTISMFPMLAMASGFSYSEMIDTIVQLGIERAKKRKEREI